MHNEQHEKIYWSCNNNCNTEFYNLIMRHIESDYHPIIMI